jgi:ParB-like chromosome segregation protein Spo0J
VISHYDYRVLRSWAVNEAAHPTVTRLPLRQIESTRTALVPERLASVREAIETGTYLLPLDVRKAGTGYTVINGNHRVQAALDLGLDEVPVIIETSAH